MLRVFYILFYFVIVFFITANKETQAACTCECVNGRSVPICSSTMDLPPFCSQMCPLNPSQLQPLGRNNLPPLGTRNCEFMQVYNPVTHIYEWKNVCY